MVSVKNQLYLKASQSVEVKMRDVTLGDVIEMECADDRVVSKLKMIKLMQIPDQGKHRFVVSILKIIEMVHKEYPELVIQNLGATDIIVTYEDGSQKNKFMEVCKVAFVAVISFIGAAFAIMTFNNDSGTTALFSQIYEMFMGRPKEGFSILELSYSAGLVIGILAFFNHFGKRKFTVDPTPIEIEMRLYEKDIQNTLIEEYSRRGKTIDVGQANSTSNHRA